VIAAAREAVALRGSISWILIPLVAAGLAFLPLAGPTITTYATRVLIGALFAQAFNVLWSQARLLSFGQAAYFGCGGFAVIHLMRLLENSPGLWPTPLVPVAGLVVGLIVGSVAGYFATARTGTYFAMITLAMGELFHTIAPKWDSVFGGESGLSSMRMPWLTIDFARPDQVYYVVLVWTLIGIALLWYCSRTIFGRIAIAVGDDEGRLAFLGRSTRILKTILFAISAAIAGLAGGLLTFTTESVGYDVFSAANSAAPLMHTFIGGAGAFLGPSVGAGIMVVFGQALSDISRNWLFYQGAGFIIVILALPTGIVGGLTAVWERKFPVEPARQLLVIRICVGAVLLACGLILFAEVLQRTTSSAALQALGYARHLIWAAGALIALAGFAMIVHGRQALTATSSGKAQS